MTTTRLRHYLPPLHYPTSPRVCLPSTLAPVPTPLRGRYTGGAGDLPQCPLPAAPPAPFTSRSIPLTPSRSYGETVAPVPFLRTAFVLGALATDHTHCLAHAGLGVLVARLPIHPQLAGTMGFPTPTTVSAVGRGTRLVRRARGMAAGFLPPRLPVPLGSCRHASPAFPHTPFERYLYPTTLPQSPYLILVPILTLQHTAHPTSYASAAYGVLVSIRGADVALASRDICRLYLPPRPLACAFTACCLCL